MATLPGDRGGHGSRLGRGARVRSGQSHLEREAVSFGGTWIQVRIPLHVCQLGELRHSFPVK